MNITTNYNCKSENFYNYELRKNCKLLQLNANTKFTLTVACFQKNNALTKLSFCKIKLYTKLSFLMKKLLKNLEFTKISSNKIMKIKLLQFKLSLFKI